MRTTATLEEDAMRAAALFAERQGISLGKAASELIRRGSGCQLGIRTVNGLPIFDVPEDFPKISAEQVRELLDE